MPEMKDRISQRFEFLNTGNSFTALLSEMLLFVGEALPAAADKETVLFKAKYILTELLTNAIKHSGTNSSFFDIDIENKALRINKTDTGRPLKFALLNEQTYPYSTCIAGDAMHVLYASCLQPGVIKFFAKENTDDTEFDINNIFEHFGLLIITKSSDDFRYFYEAQTGLNHFETKVNF